MGWSAGWASFTRIDGMGIYKQGKAVVFQQERDCQQSEEIDLFICFF